MEKGPRKLTPLWEHTPGPEDGERLWAAFSMLLDLADERPESDRDLTESAGDVTMPDDGHHS